MSAEHDGDLMNDLRGISQVRATEAESQKAIEAAGDALLRERARRKARWRSPWLWRIPAGIAAAVAVMFMTSWVVACKNTAEWNRAVKVAATQTSGQSGWVHIKFSVREDRRDMYYMARKNMPPDVGTVHMNTVDGTYAISFEPQQEGKKSVYEFHSPATGEQSSYNKEKNEIEILSMNAGVAQMYREAASPASVADFVATFSKRMGRDPISIQKFTEGGGLIRYELKLFETKIEAKAAAEKAGAAYFGDAMTIWVNASTGLFARVSCAMGENQWGVAEYSYGGPAIVDIYGLGVRKDAMVVDRRIKGDTKTITERIDGRVAKGLGDYVALLSSYPEDAEGKVVPNHAFVTLFAAQGDKWLVNRYWLVAAKRSAAVMKEMPENWPLPDVEKLLPALRNASPSQYYVVAGARGWTGYYDEKTKAYPWAREFGAKEYESILAMMGLVGQIWPSGLKSLGGKGVSAERVEAADRPGLVGVRVTESPTKSVDASGVESTRAGESVYWFDPARDDMPVEWVTKESDEEGGKWMKLEVRTRFLEYAQLPDGRWYPTRWEEERSNANWRNGKAEKSKEQYRLQILPKLRLGEEWFAPPAGAKK